MQNGLNSQLIIVFDKITASRNEITLKAPPGQMDITVSLARPALADSVSSADGVSLVQKLYNLVSSSLL